MLIEQMYTGCLSRAAYYIESDGEAAIIDPLHDVQAYINKARHDRASIKYILQTDFHGDLATDHITLRDRTGAVIVLGPAASPSFRSYVACDGQELLLGKCRIRVIHTPGHTMQSTCYLLIDEQGKEHALFTGETLLINDIGRPDAEGPSLTKERLASLLYDSLHEKIVLLPDDVVIYPAHASGSLCAKNNSDSISDTLGNQKKENFGLNTYVDKNTFIRDITEESGGYVPADAFENDEAPQRGLHGWSPDAFEELVNATAGVIIDTRKADSFRTAFIPNSINIGIDGNFSFWANALIPDPRQNIFIVADPGREQEVVGRLKRAGFDHCLGHLKGGFASWLKSGKAVDTISSVNCRDLARLNEALPLNVIDVRKDTDFSGGHIKGAINIPLEHIDSNMVQLNRDNRYYIYCTSDYKSTIFASILKSRGFSNIIDVKGGFNSIRKTEKFNIISYVKPVMLL